MSEQERKRTESSTHHESELSVSYMPGIALIGLSAPGRQSRLNAHTVEELYTHLARCDRDEDVRIVIIYSQASDFCLGMDFSAMKNSSGTTDFSGTSSDNTERSIRTYASVLESLQKGSFASVAVVHGRASAGGLGLVAACSVVLAGEQTEFSLPETLYGLVAANVFPALRRRLSYGACEYLAVSRRPFDAAAAYTRGLVDEVVAEKQLEKRVRRIAREILRNDPTAVTETRRFLRHIDEVDPEHAREAAVGLLGTRIAREDVAHAVTMVSNGELPHWAQPVPDELRLWPPAAQ